MKRRVLILTFAAIAVSFAVASSSASASTHSAARGTTIATRLSSVGRILVDGYGRTLYLYEKDTRGRSACSGSCAAYWPPVLTRGKPIAGRGAKSSLLRSIRRTDGTTQVTYNGHPLYRFVQDTRPGQTRGQKSKAFGGGWYVLSPSGRTIEGDGS